MSNLEPLTTQPDWREQYSQYLPATDNTVLPPAFNQTLGTHATDSSTPEQHYGVRPQLEHRHTLSQLDTRREVPQSPILERPDSAPGNVQLTTNGQESLVSAESAQQPLSSTQMNSLSPAVQTKVEMSSKTEGSVQQVVPKEELDEDEDDDDMFDAEDVGGLPQTEAERRAERRKMKRFRLTHQQTRFLMSEFAKQAHPDAAHRERLSREIPGLSPRQVQVWFQNRRAKIKRLTADDRERMMKMRAVPDDFDNIQALHSPYGAVHGVGTPMASPIDYGSSYNEHGMMRPLLVDTMRRQEGEEQHISPSGLSPAFGHVGFAPTGSMGTPDVLSPLSLTSNDRYYGSHLSSPLSSGPRSGNSFNRQTSSDNYQMHPHSRHHQRPLQPLQLRETMSRSRSESLQSPLRSSMSWKGDSLDYTEYAPGPTSPNLTGRQQSQFQPDQHGSHPVGNHQQYDASSYPTPVDPLHSNVPYSASQTSALQSSSNAVPRFRGTSSQYPTNLELRTQYRTLHSQQISSTINSTHAPPPSTPRSSSFLGGFSSAGFQSAPLMAPSEFQMPRTPIDGGPREYHMSQMSAPIAPPQDFANAYNQGVNMSPNRGTPSERAINQQQGQRETEIREDAAESGFISQESNFEAHKRRRSYSMGGGYNGPHQ